MLDIDLIKSSLKNMEIGKEILYFEKINSTNTFLKNGDFSHGVVAVAGSQTEGRGRRGNKWLDKFDESLLFSIILDYADISINTFTLVLGLAVIKAADKNISNNSLKIKWPNDIILNNKKIGGILCEKENNKLIIGIGLNIFNTEFENSDINWTSFKKENIYIDINSFFIDLLTKIEVYHKYFIKHGFHYFIDDYRKYCVNLNKEVYFKNGENLINAYVKNIEEDGSLLVVRNGIEENIYSGTVSIRGKDGYI